MSNYTMEQYQKDQAGFAATPNPDLNGTIYSSQQELLSHLMTAVIAGINADLHKRGIFYRQDSQKLNEKDEEHRARVMPTYNRVIALQNPLDETKLGQFSVEQLRLIHCAFGLIGEAGEIIEEVVSSFLDNRELKLKNVREELGDVMWYLSEGISITGSTFEQIAQNNIEKLEFRFKGKEFNLEASENRDVEKEQEILK